MKGILSLVALMVLPILAFADDYQEAKVLDAGADKELTGIHFSVFGGVGSERENVSTITVLIEDLIVTAEYNTMRINGAKSAANLVVGDTVQAMLDRKWLRIVLDNGKTIKATVLRRERASE
jgi:hypothetical protein